MRGGTLFSGIGAPECAAPGIDWRWCAEIEPFAAAVHGARFGGVGNLGDVEKIEPDAVEPVDLVVFGSPCQSFSVAGKRLGLDDPRGNLALVALRLVARLRPRWFLFENVPGLLSSDEGRDFGAFLGAVGECGYGWAYRLLDAQYFGVPQRRRRLFVVGHLGDWRAAAAVLFEPESLRGDPPPRREEGERAAPSLSPGTGGGSGHQYRQKGNEDALIAHALDAYSAGRATEDGTGRGTPLVAVMAHGAHGSWNAGIGRQGDPMFALDCDGQNAIASPMSVRRLTPVECERLQGLPDNWTAITWRGKPAPDGPRYRALGNAMCVPVIKWILDRIADAAG